MNRPIRRVAAVLGVLFAALFINLNVVQVLKGNEYRNHAGNERVLLTEYAHPRGAIVVQGTNIAQSLPTNDELKYLRQYPDGPVYAPATGYFSLVYGTSALENAENSVLSGEDTRLFGSQLTDLLTGRDKRGGSVVLTLNRAAQDAAYKAMQNPNGTFKRGAVVALDPTTGAIIAAVSTPSFDPAQLSSHDTAAITAYWAKLTKDPAQPLLNRAFNQTYAPGSVFKVIVSAAALKAGVHKDDQIPAVNYYWPLGGSGPCPANGAAACVHNFDNETCENGTTASLDFALAKSCNTAFAQLAVERIGGARLKQQAQAFGLDTAELDVPLGITTSTIGTPQDLLDKAALAQTSFGQRDVRLTPLQAAMISSAVANQGVLMKPYLVAQERAPNLSLLSSTQPAQVSQVLDPQQDQELQQMMVDVVTSPEGTGGPAKITAFGPSVVVGGKTGTADTGIFVNGKETPPNAWFSGFALQNGDPKIAVAVVIENGGVTGDETTGGLAAAPVARQVMEAYLRSVTGK